MVIHTTCITHQGGFDVSTRDIPTLAFIEKYFEKAESMNLSGPFYAWFAPSCNFYNADGTTYRGGDKVWSWMQSLLRPFSSVHHDIKIIRLIEAIHAEGNMTRNAYWVSFETDTLFSVKDIPQSGNPIIVPRYLMFLVGNSEIDGQGTDGLQILEVKTWWDKDVLSKGLSAIKANRG